VIGGNKKGSPTKDVYLVDVEKMSVSNHSKLNEETTGSIGIRTEVPNGLIVLNSSYKKKGLSVEYLD